MDREITLKAEKKNTKKAVQFVDKEMGVLNVPNSNRVSILTAVEEIFVNIASYAYGNDGGVATIRMRTDEEEKCITITFIDSGMKFNPFMKDDPNIDLPVEEREIGGLGIMLVKMTMDEVSYVYEGGENRVTIVKKWGEK